MHMYENTRTDILLKVVGVVLYSISHAPPPPPITLRLAILSSVAPKERATLSVEQVRPVQEVMAHRLGGRGGHRSQERDGIHLIITIKGLAAYGSGGGGKSSWRSGDEWSGQDYQRSPWRRQSGMYQCG